MTVAIPSNHHQHRYYTLATANTSATNGSSSSASSPVIGNKKQLHRRHLPTKANQHKKTYNHLHNEPEEVIVVTSSTCNGGTSSSQRRLNALRQAYVRRGVLHPTIPLRSPPKTIVVKSSTTSVGNSTPSDVHPMVVTPPTKVSITAATTKPGDEDSTIAKRASNNGVITASLAGAKRSYIPINIPPSLHEDDSDDDALDSDDDSSDDSCLSLSSSSITMNSAHKKRFHRKLCYKKLQRQKRMRSVDFTTHCAVIEIPHYTAYTPKQKKAMWNGSKMIRCMAKRNTLEYQFDKWNVNTVSEEDQFIIIDGKLVHPVHAVNVTTTTVTNADATCTTTP